MSEYRNYVLVLNDHKTWSHLDGAKIIAISDDEKEALLKESKPVDKRIDNPAISKEVMGDILKAGGHRYVNDGGYSILRGGSLVTFGERKFHPVGRNFNGVSTEPFYAKDGDDYRPSFTLTQQR